VNFAGSIGGGASNGIAWFWLGGSKRFAGCQSVLPYGLAWFGAPSCFVFADPLDGDGDGAAASRRCLRRSGVVRSRCRTTTFHAWARCASRFKGAWSTNDIGGCSCSSQT
jgi:hypothetical protein